MKIHCWLFALTLACAAGHAQADELGPRVEQERWQACTIELEHLELRDGRALFRGPRSLRNHYPYLLAASAEERAAGYGHELRASNAARLFAPIASEAAALELCALLEGGALIPDAATFHAMQGAAQALQPQATGWGIQLAPDAPEQFGASARRLADGWFVRRLVYTNAGYGRLALEEQRLTLSGEALTVARTPWISGPPQTWQTAGDVDEAEQEALEAEVERFRQAMSAILAKARTLESIRAQADAASFAQVRWRLGEPDADLGSGIHIYVYALPDGSEVVFGAPGEDSAPMYVRHVRRRGQGWDTLADLRE